MYILLGSGGTLDFHSSRVSSVTTNEELIRREVFSAIFNASSHNVLIQSRT